MPRERPPFSTLTFLSGAYGKTISFQSITTSCKADFIYFLPFRRPLFSTFLSVQSVQRRPWPARVPARRVHPWETHACTFTICSRDPPYPYYVSSGVSNISSGHPISTIELVSETPIFTLELVRSPPPPHFSISICCGTYTYQNVGWVPPPPPPMRQSSFNLQTHVLD